MKSNLFKRILAIMLILVMVFSVVACSSDESSSKTSKKKNNKATDASSNNGGSNGGNNGGNNTSTTKMQQATELSDSDLRYVMIYNPKIYDEEKGSQTTNLNVGSFGSQIDVYGNRGDGVQAEQEFDSISPQDWLKYLSDDFRLEDNRGDVMGVDYDKGDTQYFYYSSDGNWEHRPRGKFTCQYAGEYCYIWTMENISQSTINDLGQEFDDKIYKTVSETFGTPRFVGETGKVNILVYDITSRYLGYFAGFDLFVESELSRVGLDGVDCNTGHAIINVNSMYLGNSKNRQIVYGTMAHELQHLINFSAIFSTTETVCMNTWCNESMSGYIEEKMYPGSMEDEGRISSYNESDLIRNGQSLYNFYNNRFDIGVYGSVFYFSQYLEKLAGKSIFSDLMNYWRTSYSDTLCTAEALAQSVSKSVYQQINNSIDYSPLNLRFASANEEWMSKLTLNFYLSTLSNNHSISAFQDIDQDALLYDSIDGAQIEGGGRVIVALSDDTFEIPEDSDDGLIYIGLDENFKPITGFVYQ